MSCPPSYNEASGKPVFDWPHFLRSAIDGHVPFHGDQHHDAKQLAAEWVTCACGAQDARIPRDTKEGWPLDEELRSLGHVFYSAVYDGMWSKALRVLERIELRASEILSGVA